MRDFRGLPCFFDDCIDSALSSELRKSVFVATGDVGSFACEGFLTGVFVGETSNDTDPEFPLRNSWRSNTTIGRFWTGDLEGEPGKEKAVLSLAMLDCVFPGERFSECCPFSSKELTPVGEPTRFCNFWGVAPLCKPALKHDGDAGYFRGDFSATGDAGYFRGDFSATCGGVTFGHFAGVPAGVLCDVRFRGEGGALAPMPLSRWLFLLVPASENESACTTNQQYNINNNIRHSSQKLLLTKA